MRRKWRVPWHAVALAVLSFGLVFGAFHFLARDDVWRMQSLVAEGRNALAERIESWRGRVWGREDDARRPARHGRGWQGTIVRGWARVVDGDSLRVAGVDVRLHGIDAPESRQTCLDGRGRRYACGQQATRHMRRLVAGGEVICRRRDTDRYGRMVAVCTVNGHDIGRQMVRDGWAVAFVRYSRAYVSDESAARRARRGMWRGRFMLPEVWRRLRRR